MPKICCVVFNAFSQVENEWITLLKLLFGVVMFGVSASDDRDMGHFAIDKNVPDSKRLSF